MVWALDQDGGAQQRQAFQSHRLIVFLSIFAAAHGEGWPFLHHAIVAISSEFIRTTALWCSWLN
jgi:hypothetical protein